MTVSVPRFAIKLAGRECSRWNLLITQFKYTGTLPNKSSSKSKKLETKLAEGGRIERLRLRGPWYSRPVAHHGRRLPELAENSRVERPPLRGSGFPGRSGSTSPCSPNLMAAGGGIEPPSRRSAG